MPEQSLPSPALISGLLRPECYPHPVGRVRLVETHISWLLLTGSFAYKVKKPVDLGFLDFSSLAKRLHYCEEELRLNRRLAAPLYIDVVPITGTPEQPEIAGQGAPIEYAVRMHQFGDADLASVVACTGGLKQRQLDELAVRIARFHQDVPRSCASRRRGGSASAKHAVDENFGTLKQLSGDAVARGQLEQIESWMDRQFQTHAALMDRRSLDGFVRECHGDLHLGNLVVLDGRLIPFDCIEFSEDLRWIDVMSEIAFLVMDLETHHLSHLGWRFLNTYLEVTGDYEGLLLFRYFLVYRAMVRAKIALLSSGKGLAEAEAAERFRQYLDYGLRVIREPVTRLMIMHGYSGSGKSVLAGLISQGLPAIRLRSDVERKRLGPKEAVATERYSVEQTRRTYEGLRQLAELLLQAGFCVVVDATYLVEAFRREIKDLAAIFGVPFLIIDVQTSPETLRHRIDERRQQGADPSEASLQVLEQQFSNAEPIAPEESGEVWTVSSDRPFDQAAILSELRSRLGLQASRD